MEQYFGLSTDTIHKMRADFTIALNQAVSENSQYPSDPLLYARVRRMADEIHKLTKELEFRHDEEIEPVRRENGDSPTLHTDIDYPLTGE